MVSTQIPSDFLKALAIEHGVSNAELNVVSSALGGQSTAAIAHTLGVSEVAVRKRLGQVYQKFQISGSGPGKLVELKQVLLSQYQARQTTSTQTRVDWGDAVESEFFYGREAKLAELEQWISGDRCRLVAVLGMGGMGKTALVLKLAERIKDQFEYVIWRSLINPPPIQELLGTLLQFLSDGQQSDLPASFDGRLALLLDYLRQHRCLLILDNAETILQSDDLVGHYPKEREGYGELLKRVSIGRIGEAPHQSCLLLTSREKPKEVAELEGEKLLVRSLQLGGLLKEASEEILAVKGASGSEEDKRQLVTRYMGNPLALKIASATISELFNGNIAEFLAKSVFVFGTIRNLLDEQFNRLSALEKNVMYWLAINRDEQVSLSELRSSVLPPNSQTELMAVLQSLAQRSLIEINTGLFHLQAVVMEYVTDRLIEQVCRELAEPDRLLLKPSERLSIEQPHSTLSLQAIPLFRSHALIKAQAKDYVRDSQLHCILQPIIERLTTIFGSKAGMEAQLKQILAVIRGELPLVVGYAGGNLLNLLRYLPTDLDGYDFSRLTIRQAYLQGINLHGVNFAYSNVSKSVFTDTFGNILSVAFSPNGKLLAMGDANDTVRLWQVDDSDEPLLLCEGHTDWVRSVAFSPDGQLLASGSDDRTIRLWQVQTGHCLKILQGHVHALRSVAFSPDGHTLASGGYDLTVRLWDVTTGQCLAILDGQSSWVRSIAFSPNGQLLAVAGDRTVMLWSLQTRQCLQVLSGHTKAVRAVAFSPDGQTLASGSSDATVKLWSIPAKLDQMLPGSLMYDSAAVPCLHTLKGHTDRVRSIAFSADGQLLASSGDDQTVRLWDVQTGNDRNLLPGHTSRVWSVAFSPDGETLASGSDDQTVRLWNVNTEQYSQTLQGHTMQLWSVAFSPDGKILASGDDQAVRLWQVETGQCLPVLHGHSGRIRSVAFSPDGRLLASGSDDTTIRLWDLATGQCLNILQDQHHPVRAVAFSADGALLAANNDDSVRLWDVSTGQCLSVLKGHKERVWAVAFSPGDVSLPSGSGPILASAGADQTVRLWDIKEIQAAVERCQAEALTEVLTEALSAKAGSNCVFDRCLRTLDGHTDWIRSIAFSPDRQILVSVSGDQMMKLWDLATRECLRTLDGHACRIRSVAFSPDGTLLATGGEDNAVRLWHLDRSQPDHILREHSDWVRSIAFSPNGQMLASASKDETIRLWEVSTGKCLTTLRAERPYEAMNITGLTGLTDAQKTALKALGAVEHLS